MKKLLGTRVLCGGLLAVCGSLFAAPLQRADVIRDPAWVAHVDCDNLRQTALGRHLLDEMEKPDAERKLNRFQSIFEVDLRRDLHGLTVYGATPNPEDGVLVVYADFNANRLTDLARNADGYESTEHRNHTIHGWLDRRRADPASGSPRTYAAIHGRRVIFSRTAKQVADALDVLDRVSPSLASNRQFDGLDAAGADSFIVAAARRLRLPGANPGAAIFRQARMLHLTVAEAQQQVSGTLSLAAVNEETAERIASLTRGLVAFLELQTDKPEAARLAAAISVRQDGDRVRAQLSLPADDVVKLIHAKHGKKLAKR